MHKLTLTTLAVFLLLFLRNLESLIYPVMLKRLNGLKNVNVSCCSPNMKSFDSVSSVLHIQCESSFWNDGCYIEIRADNVSLNKSEVVNNQRSYGVEYIKSLRQLRFIYTKKVWFGITWKLIINTANNSAANQIGRIYFQTKCKDKAINWIPLANNFNNFKPGRTDVFKFVAPKFDHANYCVRLMSSLLENWILSSFTLIDDNKINYTFYCGKKISNNLFYGYRNPRNWNLREISIISVIIGVTGLMKKNLKSYLTNISGESSAKEIQTIALKGTTRKLKRALGNSINWTFNVITGSIGTAGLVDLTLINGKCKTRLTLNSKNNDFQPNSTDIFHMQAENCKGLEKIQIIPQETKSGWIFIQLNAKQEAGRSYVFYHNESLGSMQTFYVNQSSGATKWNVSVCSNTSTDDEVYLSLYSRHGSAENLRLTTREDDFKAGQCSNFTLFLRDLGKLWRIKIKKATDFQINRLTLYKEKEKYDFYPPVVRRENLQLMYPKMGVSIFLPDIETAGQKVKECAALCVNDAMCQQFSVVKDHCHFNQTKTYNFRSDIIVWNLTINFPTPVTQFRVLLIGWNITMIAINSSDQKQNVSTTFSTLSTYFHFPNTMQLETSPKIPCNNIQIRLIKLTEARLTTVGLGKNDNCSWKCHAKTSINRGIKSTSTMTPATYATNKDSNDNPTPITPINPNNNPTLISHSNTDSNKHTTLMPHINTDPDNNNTTLITYPNSSVILTASNDTVQTTDFPNVTTDAKLCRCLCPRNLSEEQQAELLKSLTKELKVNRTETSSYIRSKISAPDDRVSSQVIGTAAVAIMVVPFALIVLVDLIPLLSLIYKKIISFV